MQAAFDPQTPYVSPYALSGDQIPHAQEALIPAGSLPVSGPLPAPGSRSQPPVGAEVVDHTESPILERLRWLERRLLNFGAWTAWVISTELMTLKPGIGVTRRLLINLLLR